MFSSEIKVNGSHVKGSIKQGRPKNQPYPRTEAEKYLFHSDVLALLRESKERWTADEVREVAAELIAVADKVDELNGVAQKKTAEVGLYSPGTR